ncbi:MAG: hypothetical protein U0169_19890 [Polyangiaceae bacterium]
MPSGTPAALVRLALGLACATFGATPVACRPIPEACTAAVGCPGRATCVAGRCVEEGGTPAILGAERVVFRPVDALAVVARDDGTDRPRVVVARKDAPDDTVLLRFDVAIPKAARVVEAFVVFDAVNDGTSPPAPVALHLARTSAPWSSRGTTFATRPRLSEVRSPVAIVDPASRGHVRLDARAIVAAWRKDGSADQGVALVADRTSTSGVALATGILDVTAVSDGRGPAPDGPRLELYLR